MKTQITTFSISTELKIRGNQLFQCMGISIEGIDLTNDTSYFELADWFAEMRQTFLSLKEMKEKGLTLIDNSKRPFETNEEKRGFIVKTDIPVYGSHIQKRINIAIIELDLTNDKHYSDIVDWLERTRNSLVSLASQEQSACDSCSHPDNNIHP
ncbi:hypothetical protein ACIPCA_12570 [Flavobacterium covae]|uniref:Uncharacterized protein n=1 Tax=Flavobacterium davisii TaxID=2906077 RepID=A0A246GF29_9FLAO|nr:hypothetical protein [Flavobacterium davisii]OWP82728.1 hypothetical protein BWK59_14300 [Flavobacterium davisii]